MAEEPDSLVLKLLREMRAILDEHTDEFKSLHKQIDDWKETTATGVGFAAHASIRTDALEKEIAELKKRIDRLERAH